MEFDMEKSALAAKSNSSDLRGPPRQRVIKAGVIAYSGRQITLPCVVRDISESGARLQVPNAQQIPDQFELSIELDGFKVECSIAWRNEAQIGLRFISKPERFAPTRKQVVCQSTETSRPLIRRSRAADVQDQFQDKGQLQNYDASRKVVPLRPDNVEPAAALQHAVNNSIPILIAEDDPDDRLLIKEAFDESDFEHPIDFVRDGEELLSYVSGQGVFEGRPKPGLILLDLNMPKIDGRQALMHLKANPETRRIPVVAFTTSNVDEDIEKTYELGVQSYITKPSTFDGLMEVIRTLNLYWGNMVSLPRSG